MAKDKVQDPEDYNAYEDGILDIDEVPGTDIKINPDYYIHNAILKAQAALGNPDLRIGVVYYRLYVENMESLAEAARMLPIDYPEAVKKYTESDKDYLGSQDYVKDFKLATYKMKLILSKVFASKVTTAPAKA